ncbi:MAG: hypothetical protein ACJATK_000897 [Paracoccaceae bacterium]|jgi:uncharacterized protein YifN (PemK superfamily)
MDFTPQVGILIRHMYLWRDEARQSRGEGRKARPCLVVHIRDNEYMEKEVYIVPVTHTEPADKSQAIELPHATKQRLKLDHDTSWIITSEVNRFIWVGPDVRKTQSNETSYGYLPSTLVSVVIEKFKANAQDRSLGIVNRDDETLLKKTRKHKIIR